MRRALLALAVAAAALYAAGVYLFLLRRDDPLPSTAAAVVVLAGSRTRLPVALALVRRRVARVLLVSEDSRSRDPARYALCRGPRSRGYELVCRAASPFSPQGEARAIAVLASARGC